MALNAKVTKVVEELIKEMKASDEYVNFEKLRKEAMNNPELSRQIKRTRVIRDQFSKMNEYERDSQSAEALEREYDDLLDNTAVHLFSIAELELCAMYRDIMSKVVMNLDLDL